jgi:hypothetical protein
MGARFDLAAESVKEGIFSPASSRAAEKTVSAGKSAAETMSKAVRDEL